MEDDLDIPDFDMTNVETAKPCPQAGVYQFRLTEVTKEESTKSKGNYNLVFTGVLLGEVPAIPNSQGEVITLDEPEVVTYCPLQAPAPKAGAKKKSTYDFRVALAQICDAFMGTKAGTRPAKPPFKDFIGQECMVEISVESDTRFGDKPRIAKWMNRHGEG